MLKHLSQFFYHEQSQKSFSKEISYFSKTFQDREAKGIYQSDIFDFLSLIKSWPQIVGEMLGSNTSPLKIRFGSLIVLTKHSAFTQELSFMSTYILEKIFKMYPYLKKSIKNINFQTSPDFFKKKLAEQDPFSTSALFSKERDKFHAFSPIYKKIKKDAEKLFEKTEFEDEEIKNIFISLYIQRSFKDPTNLR